MGWTDEELDAWVAVTPATGPFRVCGSPEEREARAHHADVDRALDVLGAEGGRVGGSVRDLRRRWDALLDELHPPPAAAGRWGRLLRRIGLSRHARAADVALESLLGRLPVGVDGYTLQYLDGTANTDRGIRRLSPDDCLRSRVADALDDAYAVLLPHEAARKAELRRRLFAGRRRR